MNTITTVELYLDRKREWRWRALRKGRIVADSGEGYTRRATVMRSVQSLIASFKRFNYVFK